MNPQPAPASVLIADADQYICRVFEAKLTKEHPFRTSTATTGQEALLAATQNIFSAILWDMRLRDSQRILPRMRALCPGAAILLLTTDDRPTLDSDLARLDITDILVKPLNLDTLVERVRSALATPTPRSLSTHLDVARVGQRLELESASGGCVTRVLDNHQDTFTIVGAPRVDVPQDFRAGLTLRASIIGEEAVYRFGTRILKETEEPVAGWELQKPRLIRREQRRKGPRLAVSLPITLQASGSFGREAPDQTAMTSLIDGQTEDIAIGGCALVADVGLPEGTLVQFSLNPASLQPITGSGTVVRVSPFAPSVDAHGESVFRLAVAFDSLPASSRRTLRGVLDTEE